LCLKIKGLNPRPSIVKIIPPIYSHFHTIKSKAIKIKEGIRCIKKAPICCQKVRSGSKASKANKLMNSIAIMHKNRGS